MDEPDSARFMLSQHAYCFSFKGIVTRIICFGSRMLTHLLCLGLDVLPIIQSMRDVFPPVVNYNIHPKYLPVDHHVGKELYSFLQPAINQNTHATYLKELDNAATVSAEVFSVTL